MRRTAHNLVDTNTQGAKKNGTKLAKKRSLNLRISVFVLTLNREKEPMETKGVYSRNYVPFSS